MVLEMSQGGSFQDEDGEFQRGLQAGRVNERLAAHDIQFQTMTGELARVYAELSSLTLAVQRIGDQAVARDARVLATAQALKDADEARRDKSDNAWAPMTKLFGMSTLILGVLSIWQAWK